MRILLAAQFYPPDVGGEERHVHGLAREFTRRGHVVAVATQTLDGQPSVTDEDGVVVHRLRSTLMRLPIYQGAGRPYTSPLPDPELTRNLRAVVQSFRPDVIHAHNWIVHSITPLPRPRSVPLVLTLHSYSWVCPTHRMMFHDRTPCSGPAPGKCLSCSVTHYGAARGVLTTASLAGVSGFRDRRVDHVVAVSRAVAERNRLARSGLPWSVVPNFVPARLVDGGPAPARDARLPDRYILFVGELHRQKGLHVLLRAYGRLPEERPALVCLGKPTDLPDGPLPPGAVTVGPWPHDQVMAAVRACEFAVVPSTWPDPCPTTVLEAMAAGKAVIGTSTGGITDMIKDSVNGVLVEPDDEDALYGELTGLLADPARRDLLARRALSSVRGFTDERVAEQLEGVYDAARESRHGDRKATVDG